MDFPTRAEVERLRAIYPPGTRIQLDCMDDSYSPVPPGAKGTVVAVDDAGQIMMSWDNGRSLSLIPGKDEFQITQEKHTQRKTTVKHTHAR